MTEIMNAKIVVELRCSECGHEWDAEPDVSSTDEAENAWDADPCPRCE